MLVLSMSIAVVQALNHSNGHGVTQSSPLAVSCARFETFQYVSNLEALGGFYCPTVGTLWDNHYHSLDSPKHWLISSYEEIRGFLSILTLCF